MKTYRIGSAFCAESAIFGYGRWYLIGLEKYLPDVFVHRAEELLQHLVFGWVELTQIVSPSLNPAEEHDLDHVDKLDFLAYHILDAGLKSGQLHRRAPG